MQGDVSWSGRQGLQVRTQAQVQRIRNRGLRYILNRNQCLSLCSLFMPCSLEIMQQVLQRIQLNGLAQIP